MTSRLIDLSKDEVVEFKVSFLVKHLDGVLDALKAERQDRLNLAQNLVASLDEAMTFIAGYVAELPLAGKARQFADHLDHVAAVSARITKLQSHRNSLALAEVNSVVRLNLSQAKEFSL